MNFTKLFVIVSLIFVVLLSGCPQPPEQGNNVPNQPGTIDQGSIQESQDQINDIDSQISEMEDLLQDSDLSDIGFLVLDESTFE